MMIRLPFVIGICIITLFFHLGLSFLSGVLFFILTFFTNMYLTRIMARQQKEFMRR